MSFRRNITTKVAFVVFVVAILVSEPKDHWLSRQGYWLAVFSAGQVSFLSTRLTLIAA